MNKKKYVLLISAIVSLLLLLAFSIYGHYDSDDFCFKDILKKHGVLDYQYLTYMRWDGRALSISAILNLGLIKYLNPKIIILLWKIFFMLSVVYALKLSQKHIKIFSGNWLLIFPVFCFVFWLGNYTNIADTVYWCSGGLYTVNVFLLLVWLDTLKKHTKKNFSVGKLRASLFLLFTFIVASLSTQVGVVIISAIIINYLNNSLSTSKNSRKILLLIFFFSILGLFFTMLAPGNFNRATFSPRGFEMNLLAILKNSIIIYLRYIAYGAFLFILATLACSTLFKVNIKAFWKKVIYNRKSWNLAKIEFLILAIISVLPLVIIPDFAGHRPSVFFLWLCAIQVIRIFGDIFHNQINQKALFAWLSVFLIFLSVQHYSSYSFHNKLLNREHYLFKHNNNDVVEISPIKAKIIPFTYKYNDVINEPFAKHYGIMQWKYNKDNEQEPVYMRTFLNNIIF